MNRVLTTTICLIMGLSTHARISLPAIFSDHMVLQQNTSVLLWGWAKPNEVIELTASWNPEKTHKFKVENQGTWEIELETPAAGGPYSLTLKGQNTIQIEDILIGEVWLGSGQSNMEWPGSQINQAEEEKTGANFPQIRFFTVSTMSAHTPQQLLQGKWVVCSPESMPNFSAVLYFFGREIHNKLKIPVGLINSSWGGTAIEAWMPEYSIAGDFLLRENAKILKPVPWGPHEPGRIYNAMIHPLLPYKIKGVLWYQGESNVDNGQLYARSLQTLIQSWRAAWGYDFPFYFAQIAPFKGYGTDNVKGAIVRDQQRQVLEQVPQTGMAVLSDIGDLDDIHPRNKQDVGMRLALWALNKDYGMKNIAFSGPLVKSAKAKHHQIVIHFDYAGNGLKAKNGPLKEFEIMGPEGKWEKINGAKIEGNSVVIKHSYSSVGGVRYGFSNDSYPSLFNAEGLPASCFEIIFQQD